jgi:hypothetical protein
LHPRSCRRAIHASNQDEAVSTSCCGPSLWALPLVTANAAAQKLQCSLHYYSSRFPADSLLGVAAAWLCYACRTTSLSGTLWSGAHQTQSLRWAGASPPAAAFPMFG